MKYEASPEMVATVAECMRLLRPPPLLTVSEWADRYRRLSSEDSSEPGQWRTRSYQRAIMDSIHEPGCREVYVVGPTQWGKTQMLLNILGYFTHQDPAPIMCLEPTVDIARMLGEERIEVMIRDTPELSALFPDLASGKRTKGQRVLHRAFPGGHYTLGGANSAASLGSRPIRVALGDELDKYPDSAGDEGDPLKLLHARTSEFWNRVRFHVSTPVLDRNSKILRGYRRSDRRKLFVPCPHCGEFQVLSWGEKHGKSGLRWEEGKPSTARYVCEECLGEWDDRLRLAAVEKGEWRSTHDGERGVIGFHLHALYLPGTTMQEEVEDFLASKAGGPQTLQVNMNTRRAEAWKTTRGEGLSVKPLLARREEYGLDPVPGGVCLIVGSCDVQKDRLVYDLHGYGARWQSWSLGRLEVHGSPLELSTWEALDTQRRRVFANEHGHQLGIAITLVDSGNWTSQVYAYAATRRKVWAIKGQGGSGQPIIARSKPKGVPPGCQFFVVGVDSIKDIVAEHLAVGAPDAFGYCHFSAGLNDEAYMAELTAEEVIPGKGWNKRREGLANEAWDCKVYSYAAVTGLGVNLDTLAETLENATAPQRVATQGEAPKATAPRRRGVRKPRR